MPMKGRYKVGPAKSAMYVLGRLVEADCCLPAYREDILKTAKALVEDTKTLVTGAASNQEQLAVAAQNAVKTIIQLADVVKGGAASLGKENSESQVRPPLDRCRIPPPPYSLLQPAVFPSSSVLADSSLTASLQAVSLLA